MAMESDTGGRWRPRQMFAYGIDEDLQVNLSFALGSDTTGNLAAGVDSRIDVIRVQPLDLAD